VKFTFTITTDRVIILRTENDSENRHLSDDEKFCCANSFLSIFFFLIIYQYRLSVLQKAETSKPIFVWCERSKVVRPEMTSVDRRDRWVYGSEIRAPVQDCSITLDCKYMFCPNWRGVTWVRNIPWTCCFQFYCCARARLHGQ